MPRSASSDPWAASAVASAEASAETALHRTLPMTAESAADSRAGTAPWVSADSACGRLVGEYRLEREIGRGAMGVVYEAVHERIGRRAAVKLLLAVGARDPAYLLRFRAEARAASTVQHPGLVTLFRYAQMEDGTPYLLMDYLDGESLRERLEARAGAGHALPAEEAVRVARQIASAMAAVHRAGVVHRDLKPGNVMLVPDPDVEGGERATVVDFGVARLSDGVAVSPGTTPGHFVGTAAYASPEQCELARRVTDKADVYALGVVFYEMLTGDVPFHGTMLEVLHQHLAAAPPLRLVPPPLRRLLRAMLAKDPRRRPTMEQVQDALAAAPPRERWAAVLLWILLGALLLCGLFVGGWGLRGRAL